MQFCIPQICSNAQKHARVLTHNKGVLISKLQLFLLTYSGAVRLSYHHGDQEDVKWTASLWEVILTSHKHMHHLLYTSITPVSHNMHSTS